MTGADHMLEGERGFGNAMSRDVDWQVAFQNLGSDYTITRMTQKNHSCCGHTFAAIDAILQLREQVELTPLTVKAIHVASYAKAQEVCGNANPKTPYEAKFSLPYVVAMACVTGRVRLAAFSDEMLGNNDVRSLMDKVHLTIGETQEAAFPSHRSASVEVELVDGQLLRHHAPTRKGDPDYPLSDQELEDKFNELAGIVFDEPKREEIIKKVWHLDQQTSWIL